MTKEMNRMETDSQHAVETSAEAPSQYSELVVKLGPAERGGSAKGTVPPEHTHHFITTFGTVASVVAGITGAVLTLRVAAGLSGPAYAELAIAFGAAVLIAVQRADRRSGRQQLPETRARGPGRTAQTPYREDSGRET